jgi:hypothetical protein
LNPQPAVPKTEGVESQTEDPQALPADAAPRLPAGCSTPAELPSDLARVVEAWPQLPEHIKAAVQALIGAATSAGRDTMG